MEDIIITLIKSVVNSANVEKQITYEGHYKYKVGVLEIEDVRVGTPIIKQGNSNTKLEFPKDSDLPKQILQIVVQRYEQLLRDITVTKILQHQR